MMKRMTIYLGVFALVLLSINTAYSGAWTQKRGKGYYKIGFRYVRADQYYDANGNKVNIPTFADYTTSFYGEFGLFDRVTLVASVPFFKRLTRSEQVNASGAVLSAGEAKSGIADSEFGIRLGLVRAGGLVLSSEILLGVPLGDNKQANGLLTSDGEFNQLFKLQLGQSFYPLPIYFSGEAGFNRRSEGYSDEVHYAVEIGYSFNQKWLFAFKMRGIQSLKNGGSTFANEVGSSFVNNLSYLSYGPEVSYFFNRNFGITAGVEGTSLTENALSAPTFSFGVFFK